MCGIWASLGYPPDRQHIDIIQHRGPDGEGWRELDTPLGPLALGHRRLAILDLSEAGSQPMSYADGRFSIVYNGEIYNYLELREELEGAGHRFRTHTDTEVILAGFAQWGEGVLDRLTGMFAIVLWDAQAKRLFVARDRFGIKPLYYANTPQGIAFASEIKQLLGLPGVGRRANLARLHDFLASGIMEHTDETLYADVRQLRGGTCLTLSPDHWRIGEALPVRRWYNLPAPNSLVLTESQAAERFRELLSNSVRLHLRSDVPVGSCLSGGLDSSAIVCLMADLLRGNGAPPPNTFSACYAEKSVDEKPFMEAIVAGTGSTPHYLYPKFQDSFDLAERITWHQDEPYGSTSIFAQWCVFQEARQNGVKVMLDGQGADEQLAGYHGSFPYYFAHLVRTRQYAMLLRTMLERKRWHGLPVSQQMQTLVAPLLPPAVARLLRRQKQQLLPTHNWLGSDAFSALDTSRGAFDTALAFSGLPPVKNIGDLCVALTQASNLAMLLHWEDRNSMAHSIEARVPFLDHRLVEFDIALGDQHKIVGGDTKRVLRKGMTGILPENVRERRDKLGFATPEESWFRGPLKQAVRDGVEDTLSRYPGLLNAGATRAMLDEMLDGRRTIDFSLWRIINVGIWGRVFNITV